MYLHVFCFAIWFHIDQADLQLKNVNKGDLELLSCIRLPSVGNHRHACTTHTHTHQNKKKIEERKKQKSHTQRSLMVALVCNLSSGETETGPKKDGTQPGVGLV